MILFFVQQNSLLTKELLPAVFTNSLKCLPDNAVLKTPLPDSIFEIVVSAV